MTYPRKLLISKLLVTVCILFYAIVPMLIDFGPSHIASSQWTPHGRFHLSWSLIANVMALPVLLYAVWSKLHGTGRSVRLVAFLGMAYTGAFFVASSLRGQLGSDLYDPGHVHTLLGVDANIITNGGLLLLLIVAVGLSIKR